MQHLYVVFYTRMLGALLVLNLSGCVTFSEDGGFKVVQQTTAQSIKQTPVWAKSAALKENNANQVVSLLKNPLSQEDAVQIALLNNAQLQADFYDLQLAEANVIQANRLPNPSFSMLYARNSGDYKIEQALTMNIFALFTINKATEIEQKRFAAMQHAIALRVLNLARQTRNTYIRALAAKQMVDYLKQVNESANATYALAKRMREAGNWNALDEGREQSFYNETALDLLRAENQCLQAEAQLTALLGLSDPKAIRLPERLIDLPKSEANLTVVQEDAFAKRLDLQQVRINIEALAQQLGLTKTTRLINLLEIGPASVLEGRRADPVKRGVDLRFELPIFDWGTARVRRAEATYQQALQLAANQSIQAAAQVRAQYSQYEISYAIAKRYRDEIIPMRKKILDESLLRYNGMLMSPFELMSAARDQVLAVNHYIENLRDFWLAESDLTMVLVGTPLDAYGIQSGL
jgi:outer membrane protein TolC